MARKSMDRQEAFNPNVTSIREWLEGFELRYCLEELPEDRKGQWCRLTVGPGAAAVLALVPADASYADLKQKLITSYGASDEVAEAQSELSALKQDGESLKSLALRVQRLISVTLRGASEDIKEAQGVVAFLRALPDELSREVERSRHLTLASARAEAERQAALIRRDKKKTEDPTKTTDKADRIALLEEKLHQTIEDMGAKMQEQLALVRREEAPRAGRPTACFKCGQEGHFRRECPQNRNRRRGPRWATPPMEAPWLGHPGAWQGAWSHVPSSVSSQMSGSWAQFPPAAPPSIPWRPSSGPTGMIEPPQATIAMSQAGAPLRVLTQPPPSEAGTVGPSASEVALNL